MARYQEEFQGKKLLFLIRNGEKADAPALVRYMSRVNRETTFLSMEAGEFEKIYPVEREAQLLAEWAEAGYHLNLLALTGRGKSLAAATVPTPWKNSATATGPAWASPCARTTGAGPGTAAAGDSGGVVPQPGHHQAVPGGGHQQHPSPGAILANGI